MYIKYYILFNTVKIIKIIILIKDIIKHNNKKKTDTPSNFTRISFIRLNIYFLKYSFISRESLGIIIYIIPEFS